MQVYNDMDAQNKQSGVNSGLQGLEQIQHFSDRLIYYAAQDDSRAAHTSHKAIKHGPHHHVRVPKGSRWLPSRPQKTL